MAKELFQGSAKVMLLEAGEAVSPSRFLTHCWPYKMRFRGLRGEKQDPFYPSAVKNTIRYDTQEQISVDSYPSAGRAHSALECSGFARGRTLNGIEEDWSLGYDELVPYYDRIES